MVDKQRDIFEVVAEQPGQDPAFLNYVPRSMSVNCNFSPVSTSNLLRVYSVVSKVLVTTCKMLRGQCLPAHVPVI